MEVHHHAHTADPDGHRRRKKWTHYFWEFLMLFLAVFCGFLAEYRLEHTIEKQREYRYMSTLLQDLINDTTDLANDIPSWERRSRTIDTIQMLLDKPEEDRDHKFLYRNVSFIRNFNSFEYHDRTIQQLKSSGNFRLIQKDEISDSLMAYDAIIQTRLFNQQDQSIAIYHALNFLQDDLFDSRYYRFRLRNNQMDSAYKANPAAFLLHNKNNEALFRYLNHLEFYRQFIGHRITTHRQLLIKANGLIMMIKKEYHLQ